MLVARFIQAIPKSREAVQALGMRAGIVVNVTPADRRRLEAIVADRSAPQRRPTDRTSRPVATRSFDCLVGTYAKPKPGIQRYNSSRNSVLWAANSAIWDYQGAARSRRTASSIRQDSFTVGTGPGI